MTNRTFYPYRGLDFITRRYYSVRDWWLYGQRHEPDYYSPSRYDAARGSQWSFRDLDSDIPESLDFTSNQDVLTLFNNYIFPRYWDEFIAFSDEHDLTDEDIIDTQWAVVMKNIFSHVMGSIIGWIQATLPVYGKEIELYHSIENNLMAQVKVSTQTKANDTPQIPDTDLQTDPYVSNIATTEQLTDAGTPIERLKQVRNNIRNTYEKWADEFRQFVIYA